MPVTDQLNILVTYRWRRLTTSHLQRIQNVSPQLNILYAENSREDVTLLPMADILYSIKLPHSLTDAPRLKWIQLLSAGYDLLQSSPVADTDIRVTTSAGIHGIPISEYVLSVIITLSRNLHDVLRTTDSDALWETFAFTGTELHGKTIGIVGLGTIGREIARLARCFGMRVYGIDTHENPWALPVNRYVPADLSSYDALAEDSHVEVRLPEELSWLLTESDYVVLAVPLTPENRELIGKNELRRMKHSAFLINPARGALVDEQALIKALKEGWIAGAALDTFVTEPLPADSPFYSLPNVLVTPHMSAHTEQLWDRCVDVFCTNLQRYLEGKPLLNQVHPPLES